MFSSTGDKDARKALLDGRCALSIDPPTAAIPESTSLALSANSPGGDPVTWTASCGTINSSGPQTALYMAPATAEMCKITATSSLNDSLIATAAVTVTNDSGNMPSESGIELDMVGFDANSGAPLFSQVSDSVTTSGHSPLTAPFNTTLSGRYQPDSSLPPTNFKVAGISDGPIVSGANGQPPAGTYSHSVSCSDSGSSKHDANDNLVFPKQVLLRSSASGNFEPEAGPGSYTVSFTMKRGDVVGGSSGSFTQSDLVGLMVIEYSLHGEPATQQEFQLNDGTQMSGATPAMVTGGAAVRIEKGGFFQANWNIGVRCATDRTPDDPPAFESVRAGTMTVSYEVTLDP
jgi:hypothetical protein